MKRIFASRSQGCANMPSKSRCSRANGPKKPRSRRGLARSSRITSRSSPAGKISPPLRRPMASSARSFPSSSRRPSISPAKSRSGIMTQTARAFGSVNEALNFFVTYYVSLADFKSVLDRLTSFELAIENREDARLLTAAWEPTRKRRENISTSRRSSPASRRPRDHQDANLRLGANRARACDRPVGLRQIDACSGRSPAFGLMPTAPSPCRQTPILCCCRKSPISRSAPCAPP